MQGTVLYGPGDVRFEDVETPRIIHPTDAIIRLAVTSVCGSDLWPYRGIQPIAAPTPMGHEYCGVVEEVGSAVKSVKPGEFVIGSFFASDNTCPHCVILMRDTDRDGAVLLAERLRRYIDDNACTCSGAELAMTVSIGVSVLQDTDTPVSLFARADQALYSAKRDGRNQVCLAEPSLR